MRVFLVVAVLTAVLFAAARSGADGLFVPREGRTGHSEIDPRSHAWDITEPTQKALIVFNQGVEDLILQVSYRGDVSQFAWLVPTPAIPRVAKVDKAVFHILHELTAPRIRYDSGSGAKSVDAAPAPPRDVEVIEEKQLGAYDIAVLRSGSANDLLEWLRTNGYAVDEALQPVIRDYIGRGWVFTAMRVDVAFRESAETRLRDGVLQSLRFTFSAPEPIYPLRVSALNRGATDLLLYVIADHRVTDQLMTTLCSIESHLRPEDLGMSDMDLPPTARLTKLSANLEPGQMTRDIVLERTPNNEIVPVETSGDAGEDSGRLVPTGRIAPSRKLNPNTQPPADEGGTTASPVLLGVALGAGAVAAFWGFERYWSRRARPRGQ